MPRLATPVSHLFRDVAVARAIATLSPCLEGREHAEGLVHSHPEVFHFEANVVAPWDEAVKAGIGRVVDGNTQLQLISFHVACSCSAPVVKDGMFLSGGKMYTREELIAYARQNIGWMKGLIGSCKIRIAVENNNYYPTEAYRHVTAPDFISGIVRENGIEFLFDIAHGRISAHNMGMNADIYDAGLPLERMVQVHVSQWAVDAQSRAFDSHEFPTAECTKEVLALVRKHKVEYVTVEYYKDPEKLLGLLEEYRKALEG